MAEAGLSLARAIGLALLVIWISGGTGTEDTHLGDCGCPLLFITA